MAKDDPLSKFVPDFPRGGDILVRHLMFHQSGLPHRATRSEDEFVTRSAADMVELAAKAARWLKQV